MAAPRNDEFAVEFVVPKNREVEMPKQNWIGLSRRERTILLDALKAARGANGGKARDIDALMVKLTYSPPHPEITVGVHGGQVQWTLGNPFPIRVCDYDGDREELLDIDERGQRCRICFEPRSDESLT
jgi:hypothetical protein